jgi:hypothetical protein
MLVSSMSAPFDPTELKNTFHEKVLNSWRSTPLLSFPRVATRKLRIPTLADQHSELMAITIPK